MVDTTDMERRPAVEMPVTADYEVERMWKDRQIALIARTVAKGANAEELHLFLQTAARLNLNPLATGEIWLVKTGGENGEPGRMVIIVGEQGRLKIANRYDDYTGFRCDTVCAEDRFLKLAEPKQLPDGQWSYVEHSYGHPKDRGDVLGAWCEVYRTGRPPTYFYAPLDEYFPHNASERAKKFIPWFSTSSRMIVKCSISTAFRMAFNLSGVYGPEEIDHVLASQSGGGGESPEDAVEWGESGEVAERMQSLFAAANNTRPGSFTMAKIAMLLKGLSDDERYAFAEEELIPFIRRHGGVVPEPGETVVADGDVEVVAEGEAEAQEGAAPEMHRDRDFRDPEEGGEEPWVPVQDETLPGL